MFHEQSMILNANIIIYLFFCYFCIVQKIKERKNIKQRSRIFFLAAILLTGCIYLYLIDNEAKNEQFLHYPPIETKLIERTERFIKSHSLRDDQLGLYIYDLTSDDVFYSKNELQLMPPASCTKLVTAISSIKRFGIDYAFKDSLFYEGYIEDGILYGNIILKADADPALWDFKDMTDAIKNMGIQTIYGTIKLRLSLKEPMKMHNSWGRYDMNITQLPILFQGEEAIRNKLKKEIEIQSIYINEAAPTAPKALKLNYIKAVSHSLHEILTPMVLYSDNIYAQCIWTSLNSLYCRFTPNQDFPQNYLIDFIGKELKMPYYLYTLSDACGLSPENRLSPKFLADLLHWAYNQEKIRKFLIDEALPIPGDSERKGSLHWRMERSSAAGKVYSKTGTLNRLKATTLAGYLLTETNHVLVFAIMNKNMNLEDSRMFQDQLCIELTRP